MSPRRTVRGACPTCGRRYTLTIGGRLPAHGKRDPLTGKVYPPTDQRAGYCPGGGDPRHGTRGGRPL